MKVTFVAFVLMTWILPTSAPVPSVEEVCFFHPEERNDRVAWTVARDSCAAANGNLITSKSQDKQEKIDGYRNLTYPNNPILWLGLSDIDHDGEFTWVDGSALDIALWKSGQPNPNKLCAINHKDDWRTKDCTETFLYLCEVTFDAMKQCPSLDEFILQNGTLSNFADGIATFTCDPGYYFATSSNKSDIKTVDCTDCDLFPKTWADRVGVCTDEEDKCIFLPFNRKVWGNWTVARDTCAAAHGNIITSKTQYNQDKIDSLLDTGAGERMWLGLNDIDDDGVFTYEDGSLPDFELFDRDNYDSTNLCVLSLDKVWRKRPCHQITRCVCQVTFDAMKQCPGLNEFILHNGTLTKVENSIATFTCDPGYYFASSSNKSVIKTVDCMDCELFPKTWAEKVGVCTDEGDKCIFHPEERNVRVVWTVARDSCAAANGNLITSKSQFTQDMIDSYSNNDRMWLGLSDIDVHGSFTWVDGSIPGFEQFPHDHFNSTFHCAMSYEKVWYKRHCDREFIYLCEVTVDAMKHCPAIDSFILQNSTRTVEGGIATFTCDPGYYFAPIHSVNTTVDCMDCELFPKAWTEQVDPCTVIPVVDSFDGDSPVVDENPFDDVHPTGLLSCFSEAVVGPNPEAAYQIMQITPTDINATIEASLDNPGNFIVTYPEAGNYTFICIVTFNNVSDEANLTIIVHDAPVITRFNVEKPVSNFPEQGAMGQLTCLAINVAGELQEDAYVVQQIGSLGHLVGIEQSTGNPGVFVISYPTRDSYVYTFRCIVTNPENLQAEAEYVQEVRPQCKRCKCCANIP